MSIAHAIKAVTIPINKNMNHRAKFFFTTNLYPFLRSSSNNK